MRKKHQSFNWYGLSQRFSIRKYHVGAVSVLLGLALANALMATPVQASELNEVAMSVVASEPEMAQPIPEVNDVTLDNTGSDNSTEVMSTEIIAEIVNVSSSENRTVEAEAEFPQADASPNIEADLKVRKEELRSQLLADLEKKWPEIEAYNYMRTAEEISAANERKELLEKNIDSAIAEATDDANLTLVKQQYGDSVILDLHKILAPAVKPNAISAIQKVYEAKKPELSSSTYLTSRLEALKAESEVVITKAYSNFDVETLQTKYTERINGLALAKEQDEKFNEKKDREITRLLSELETKWAEINADDDLRTLDESLTALDKMNKIREAIPSSLNVQDTEAKLAEKVRDYTYLIQSLKDQIGEPQVKPRAIEELTVIYRKKKSQFLVDAIALSHLEELKEEAILEIKRASNQEQVNTVKESFKTKLSQADFSKEYKAIEEIKELASNKRNAIKAAIAINEQDKQPAEDKLFEILTGFTETVATEQSEGTLKTLLDKAKSDIDNLPLRLDLTSLIKVVDRLAPHPEELDKTFDIEAPLFKQLRSDLKALYPKQNRFFSDANDLIGLELLIKNDVNNKAIIKSIENYIYEGVAEVIRNEIVINTHQGVNTKAIEETIKSLEKQNKSYTTVLTAEYNNFGISQFRVPEGKLESILALYSKHIQDWKNLIPKLDALNEKVKSNRDVTVEEAKATLGLTDKMSSLPDVPKDDKAKANLDKIKKNYPNGFKYAPITKWVNGVTPPSEAEFKIISEYSFDPPYTFYTVPDDKGNTGNWYDINKKFSDAKDQNLCYAAVSGNMLHWWMTVNSDYIDRFLALYPEQDKGNRGSKKISTIYDYLNSYKNQEESKIFEDFTTYFRARKNGGWTDAINDFFINGYKPNFSMTINQEGTWNKNDLDKRGGYFSEVFGGHILSTRDMANNKASFNRLLKQYLDGGQAVGVAFRFGKSTGPLHIISLWGAEFDDKGDVTAIYVTDSDDGIYKYDTIDNVKDVKKGLFRYHVTYDNLTGRPRISATTEPTADTGGYVDYLYGLKPGQDKWQDFFEKADVKQKEKDLQDAKTALKKLIDTSRQSKDKDISQNINASRENLAEAIQKAEGYIQKPRANERDYKEAKDALSKALKRFETEKANVTAEKSEKEVAPKAEENANQLNVEKQEQPEVSQTPSVSDTSVPSPDETITSDTSSPKVEEPEEVVPVPPVSDTTVPVPDEPITSDTLSPEVEEPKEVLPAPPVSDTTVPRPEESITSDTSSPKAEEPREVVPVLPVPDTSVPVPEESITSDTSSPKVEEPKEVLPVPPVSDTTVPHPEESITSDTSSPKVEEPKEVLPVPPVSDTTVPVPDEPITSDTSAPKLEEPKEVLPALPVPDTSVPVPDEPITSDTSVPKTEEPKEVVPVLPVPDTSGSRPDEPITSDTSAPKVEEPREVLPALPVPDTSVPRPEESITSDTSSPKVEEPKEVVPVPPVSDTIGSRPDEPITSDTSAPKVEEPKEVLPVPPVSDTIGSRPDEPITSDTSAPKVEEPREVVPVPPVSDTTVPVPDETITSDTSSPKVEEPKEVLPVPPVSDTTVPVPEESITSDTSSPKVEEPKEVLPVPPVSDTTVPVPDEPITSDTSAPKVEEPKEVVPVPPVSDTTVPHPDEPITSDTSSPKVEEPKEVLPVPPVSDTTVPHPDEPITSDTSSPKVEEPKEVLPVPPVSDTTVPHPDETITSDTSSPKVEEPKEVVPVPPVSDTTVPHPDEPITSDTSSPKVEEPKEVVPVPPVSDTAVPVPDETIISDTSAPKVEEPKEVLPALPVPDTTVPRPEESITSDTSAPKVEESGEVVPTPPVSDSTSSHVAPSIPKSDEVALMSSSEERGASNSVSDMSSRHQQSDSRVATSRQPDSKANATSPESKSQVSDKQEDASATTSGNLTENTSDKETRQDTQTNSFNYLFLLPLLLAVPLAILKKRPK